MHELINIEMPTLVNRINRKVEALQSPIATIEIILFLLEEEIQNEKLSTIKAALQKIRHISKQMITE